MIEYKKGNIIENKAELLINASNGKGWMGGLLGRCIPMKGVAESIHFHDHSIEKEAKNICKSLKINVGDVFLTSSGSLQFNKGILHAVTMNKPNQKSTLYGVEKCLINISCYCIDNNISSVSIPLLGTGTGKLDKIDVIDLYAKHLTYHPTRFDVILKPK